MNHYEEGAGLDAFEQVSQICREFRKLLAQGQSPKIEKYLPKVPPSACEPLFSNLLEVEINFRQRRGEQPTSGEYLKRFPQYSKQVRRAFFEPTLGSCDSAEGSGETGATRSALDLAIGERDAPTFDLPAANHLGDYELLRELGRGGMGVVYEARHTKTGNRVALKTLPAGQDDQEVNADRLYRFRKEFRSLSEINHPNLVGMQSLEVDGGQWFFTMDLVDGEDFLSYVRPGEQLDLGRLRSALPQLVQGLTLLHQRRIVHRDVKPSNVLVEPEGTVKLLDFGLVAELQKGADLTQTRSAHFAGTPKYAAPEQMFGQRSEASDWYAVGVMLYEALTGQPPFISKEPMEVLRLKQQTTPPALYTRTDLPADLAELADGLLKREPAERLTAAAISERLHLDTETRLAGSSATAGTKGSQGSSASPEEELDPALLVEDEEQVLIGRESQLAELEAACQLLLQTRQPQVVFISGLSGEGKSALVEKFLHPFRSGSELLVLSGRCYDRESVPFKAVDCLIESLVNFLRRRSPGQTRIWIPEDVSLLAFLFPIMRRVPVIADRCGAKPPTLDSKQLRYRAFSALRDLVHNISQTIPVLMFVDDLQWGDADSAEAILGLLEPPDSPTVLFLGSYRRDEAADSPFLATWHRVLSETCPPLNPRIIEVTPLTAPQCLELVALKAGFDAGIMREQANELFADSQGNPYFLEQLIEGFDVTTGSFRAVPLNEMISAKLTRLPAGAIDLLNAVAVAGKATSLAEVSHVAGQDKSVLGIVTHMRNERLVRLVGSNDRQIIDTYHDKIREQILSSLNEAQKKKLHLRFGDYLENRYLLDSSNPDNQSGLAKETIFDLAQHLDAANDPRSFGYLLRAGQFALNAGAMETALDMLRRAERIKPPILSANESFALQFAMGRAFTGCQLTSDSNAVFISAIDAATSPIEVAQCHFELGQNLWKTCEFDSAIGHLAKGLAAIGEYSPSTLFGKFFRGAFELLRFHFVPAWGFIFLRQRPTEFLQLASRIYSWSAYAVTQYDISQYVFVASRGCVIAKVSNNNFAKAEAYSTYGSLLAFIGLGTLARWMIKRAKSVAQLDPSAVRDSSYSYGLGVYYYCVGQLDEAKITFSKASSVFEKSASFLQRIVEHFLWHVSSVTGNTRDIFQHAKREEQIAVESNDQVFMAYAWYGQSEGLARAGRTGEAIALVDQSIDQLRRVKSTMLVVANVQKSKVLIQSGNYPAAVAAAWSSIVDIPKLRFFDITVPAMSLYVEASLADQWFSGLNSKRPRGRSGIRVISFLARLAGWMLPNNRPAARRTAARLAASRRKKNKALRLFDKAIASAERIGAEYELGRSLVDKSMLDHSNAAADRARGLALLEALECVLPEAEQAYLGISMKKPPPFELPR